MNNILIVKTSALGDVIHTYPVIDYLRKKFPSAQIDWVIEESFSDLVQSHEAVSNTLTIATKAWRKKISNWETLKSVSNFRKELRKQHYDVIFDLQGNIKSGIILSQARGTCKVGFGKKTVSEWPNLLFTNRRYNPSKNLNIRLDYLALVTSFFGDPLPLQIENTKLKISKDQQTALNALIQKNETSKGPTVVVCSGSAWPNKQLSIDTLKAFLLLLQPYLNCTYLFVWGSVEEKLVAEQLSREFATHSDVLDKMSLSMLQNLMELSDLVIAVDSLPLHLAGTTSTPTFSVFGASSALKYKPLGENHYAFQGTCPYGRSFEKRCPILRSCPTGACIRNLKASQLFEAFKSWWH